MSVAPPPAAVVETSLHVELEPQARRNVICCLMAGAVLFSFNDTALSVAFTIISKDLGRTDLFGWLVSAYVIAAGGTIPIYARCSEVVGRQACMQVALAIFGLGTILCATAQSMMQLIIYRSIQGAGGGTLFAQCSVILSDITPPHKRGEIMALLGVAEGLFFAIGPLIGGCIINILTWRYIFWLQMPLIILTSLAFAVLMRIPRRDTARRQYTLTDFDLPAIVAISSASVLLVLAVSLGGASEPWSSGIVIGSLVGSAVLTVIFVLLEQRSGDKAVVPMEMFASRNFCICVILTFIYGGLMNGIVNFVPSWFQNVQGTSVIVSGLATSPFMFSLIIVAVIVGKIIATGRTNTPAGYRWYTFGGNLLEVVATIVIAVTFAADINYGILCVLLITLGVGCGIAGPVLQILAGSTVKPRHVSAAMSTHALCQTLGNAVCSAVLTSLFNNRFQQEISSEWPDAPSLAVDQQAADIGVVGQSEFDSLYTNAFGSIWLFVAAVTGLSAVTALFIKQNTLTFAPQIVELPPLQVYLDDTTPQSTDTERD